MTTDAREVRRRELRRRLSGKHDPIIYLPEPQPLARGCAIRVLGGTAAALAHWQATATEAS
jgi:hypothetical protein